MPPDPPSGNSLSPDQPNIASYGPAYVVTTRTKLRATCGHYITPSEYVHVATIEIPFAKNCRTYEI